MAAEGTVASALGRRSLLQAALAFLSACAFPLAARAQAAGKGYALLVGNTSYNPAEENLPPAEKCLRDLESQLKRFGFEVVTFHDVPVAQVQAEVAKLQRAVAADPQMPAVFYFVGHGFQSNAENFLVPAGSDPEKVAPNHSPRFFVDEGGLVIGVRALANLACDYLESASR